MAVSLFRITLFVIWCSLVSKVSGQSAADWMSGKHGVGFRISGGVGIETALYDVDVVVNQIKDEIPEITWILLGISSGAYGDRYNSPHSILTDLNRACTPKQTENVSGQPGWMIVNGNGLTDFNLEDYPDRDLYSEIANAFQAAGFKVVAYMAAQGPTFMKHGETRAYDYDSKSIYVNSITDCNDLTNGAITDGKCSPSARRWRNKVIELYGNDTDSTLQLAYADLILREYANKFDGKEGRALVDAWWFDQGIYMDIPLAHEIIMEANPNAAIAFNKGVKIPLMNNNPPYEAFTGGHPNPITKTLPTDMINLPIIESMEETADGYFESGGSYSLGHVFQMTNTKWNNGALEWGGDKTPMAIDWMSRVINAKGAWTWNVKRSFFPYILHPEDVALLKQIYAGLNSTSPTESPTLPPTTSPTKPPTSSPEKSTTNSPTLSPTTSPTKSPILSPVTSPTKSPTSSPTTTPTKIPTSSPTNSPTKIPTLSPTNSSTKLPTSSPTTSPTKPPTLSPTTSPTKPPTSSPTTSPTKIPTSSPTIRPTKSPTSSPEDSPTKLPTSSPTTSLTMPPTSSPTISPTKLPTLLPTISPTQQPTSYPSTSLAKIPTSSPSTSPPTIAPSFSQLCGEASDDEFLAEISGDNPRVRTCKWLYNRSKENQDKICKRTKSLNGYKKPADVCKFTCGIRCPTTNTPSSSPIIACDERPNDRFAFKLKSSGPETRPCSFLSLLTKSNTKKVKRLCASGLSFEDIGSAGSAADNCQVTCKTCRHVEPSATPIVPCIEKYNYKFFFRLRNDKSAVTRTCGWLAYVRKTNRKKLKKICKQTDRYKFFKSARNTCLKTCDTCPNI